MTYQEAFYTLRNALQPLYDEGEATAIAHEAMEALTGLGRMERLLRKEEQLDVSQLQEWDRMKRELLAGRPLQYVTGYAWFMGRKFIVSNEVLIPRPETEELVQWIVDDCRKTSIAPRMLDIGTGSGCIPVSLKLALPEASVTSVDISPGALETARQNAAALNANITLIRQDFLDTALWAHLPQADVLVSNPPYIPLSEKESLHANVRDHEPGMALFVPNDDPLLFYRALAAFGKQCLKPGAALYCELHRDHASATKEMAENAGYRDVVLRKDLNGHERMLKAIVP